MTFCTPSPTTSAASPGATAGSTTASGVSTPSAVDLELDALALQPGSTVLVHGADTPCGRAAVRSALEHGLQVVATTGPTRALELHRLGAAITRRGGAVVERVLRLAGGPVDAVLDAAPATSAHLDLARLTVGDHHRVVRLADPAPAEDDAVLNALDWAEGEPLGGLGW